jgi:serine/threonine-protein kinase
MSSSFGFEPGTIIGGLYRVIDVIGRGGMGVVLRAHDAQLERDVAIKLIRPELLTDSLRERFLAEARAMARVIHPNVLPIYSFGEHEGAPYFVTQIVRGQTVEQWLKERDPELAPDLDTAFKILESTCRGVAAIHAAETVHRDLKPSNLLLDPEFSVCVADMGVSVLAKSMSQSGPESERRNEIAGTPYYMAPECVLQADTPPELAHRADVYALGCLAYELLTGAPPFQGSTMIACMLAHLNQEPPRASSRRSDLSEEIDAVLFAALAKDPADRTPSADAFRRALIAARTKTRAPVRILVAEDDEDFRELLGMTLRHEFPDAVVECVADGQEALAAFDERPPSVAILDLAMPKIDGTKLTELVRARDGAYIPILVLTGSGGPREWQHLSAVGADGFLVKPVNVRDVATMVVRVLADRQRDTPLIPESKKTAAAKDDARTRETTITRDAARRLA